MRVLVVDDEPAIRESLRRGLVAGGWAVDTAPDGEAGLELACDEEYDVVVLDIMMPRRNGYEVVREMRRREVWTPVLMLTAKDGEYDEADAFDLGADDYLVKPFHMEELAARLRALIRRAAGQAANELRCGPLTLDLRGARVCLDGQPLTLTSHEFRVLAYLMQRRGQAVTRGELSEHVYPLDSERDSNTIEVFVGRLRKKLPSGMIETLRGLGYRMNDTP